MEVYLFIDSDARLGWVSRIPRVARIVLPGLPHHVTRLGKNRQDTFFIDDDYVPVGRPKKVKPRKKTINT